ncbi:MAG: 4'-phosphopantetheinyl transferase superfamily protein [Firmicutes bacterium]|nr:4'-phosphopantetheinyl transferase superfamily protein [Bacillota bacterium]
MKYCIYVYEGNLKSEDLRRALVMEAVSAYCQGRNIDFDAETAVILKGEKGKPYIDGLPVHFNVSHTGTMWMCITGPQECGLDLQQEKECDYEKIAARHFSPDEQAYVREHGLAGFFRIWTRREAYGKYTGQGFYGDMPSFAAPDGSLPEYTGGAYLREIPIADDIFCVYCTGGKDDEIEFFG